MEIIQIQEKDKWNHIVKSFPDWDIYYLNEYAFSLHLHGDGIPYLIYHNARNVRLCYIVMQTDIADFPQLSPYIQHGQYFDWSTPYGYGGPLISGNISEIWIWEFQEELKQWCISHNIVSQFIRFHPLLQNQKSMEKCWDVVYLKKTVYVATDNQEIIFQNMTPNNRNMVRKAIKNGIKIIMDKGERSQEFKTIYEETMKNNNADKYYFFEKEYFDYLTHNLNDHVIFFYALYEDRPISSAIFFYNDKYMHYHLSGTLPEYKKLASANLLLSKQQSGPPIMEFTSFI